MEEMNTPINASAASSWLSDFDIDEYNIFPEECHLKFLDADDEVEEFLSRDIASALQGPTLQQQSLTSECTSTTTLSNSFTDETSFDLDQRPTKMPKTISSGSITENFSPKLSPSTSSPISSFHQSQILSFDNPNSSPTQFYGFDRGTLNPPKQNEAVPQLGNTHFSTDQNPKGSSKNQNCETKTSHGTKRSPAHAQDHIMAERKRREKLSQSFIALAALVPGLKKMDKASVLADAIKYVKELKERVVVLEEQSKKTKAESVVVVTKPENCSDDDCSSCDESVEAAGGSESSLFQAEARVSGKEMLIRIHCQKQKGLLVKIMAEIQTLHLFVINSSVLPFGDSILDITIIAQMGEGYNLTIKELIKNLRMATLKSMS
uniref:BHLH transcription factor 3 n=1 Tax=Glycyrrhiza uralensis TaxID=74613 RepID=A0A2Z6BDF1_GLYUR|nr:bHLH transcription factor 3 [Glycyrrhiza uralensis]